jgi:bifunctional non-homologous end joining protein LigD
VDGHDLQVSSLDKALWPAAPKRRAFTKRHLLRYLARVSRWMLPHLADRPLFVTRFPAGIGGKSFYQKHWDDPPAFARTVAIYSSHGDTDGDYLICENLPTLLWLGQMASLELHTWYSRTDPEPDATAHQGRFTGSEAALERSVLNYPDFVVFDLDPYDYSGREARGAEPELHRRAFNRTRKLALQVREQLERLTTYVKTSVDSTISVVREPTSTPRGAGGDDESMRSWRHGVTIEWAVERRRVTLSTTTRTSRQTCRYSTRRHPSATVSTPVRWEELERIYPTDFTIRTVPDRLEAEGDPWDGILSAKQDLGTILGVGGAA